MADNLSPAQAKAVPAPSSYKPKPFDKQKYDVSSYQYPSDLMGYTTVQNPQSDSDANIAFTYGGNYVVFYINVNNESKMLENSEIQTVPLDPSERVMKNLAGKNYSQGAVVAAQTIPGAAAGAAAGMSGGIGSALKGAVVGGAAGAIGTASVLANTKNSTFSRPQKRLKTAIALHVPNQLSIKYGANWSDEETFGIQALIDGGEAVGRALVEAGKALANNNSAGVMSAITGGGKGVSSIIANAALSQGPNKGALSAMTGLAPNPMKEQVFKGVDFRTFTMDYQFAPRNEKEAANVLKIIQAFKYHMHPEYKTGSGNFLFLYPSEFDISYFHGGEENLNIHRHTSCVLTDMDVNYTPNGNFSTFKGGMPTQINMTLSFKELTILTKELIAEGL